MEVNERHSEWFSIRQIDNTSPGCAPGGKLVPGSHKRCEHGHIRQNNSMIS